MGCPTSLLPQAMTLYITHIYFLLACKCQQVRMDAAPALIRSPRALPVWPLAASYSCFHHSGDIVGQLPAIRAGQVSASRPYLCRVAWPSYSSLYCHSRDYQHHASCFALQTLLGDGQLPLMFVGQVQVLMS